MRKDLNKQNIRRLMKQRRESLSPVQVASYSSAAINQLICLGEFKRSYRIGIYFPVRNELSPLELAYNKNHRAKKIFLPVVMPLRFQPLLFAPFSSKMVLNRYGIPEPDVSANALITVRDLDLLLLPLLAFDSKGTRIGYGGGFYDKTLAYLRQRKYWRKPRMIGLAYSFQQCATLPAHSWDIQLPMIVTEKGVTVTSAKTP